MSLHIPQIQCVHAPLDNQPDRYGYRASCRCGWIGKTLGDGSDISQYGEAVENYVAHIEDVLGVDGYYTAEVACINCGSHHSQSFPVGLSVSALLCERCGVKNLRPNNEVVKENTWDIT